MADDPASNFEADFLVRLSADWDLGLRTSTTRFSWIRSKVLEVKWKFHYFHQAKHGKKLFMNLNHHGFLLQTGNGANAHIWQEAHKMLEFCSLDYKNRFISIPEKVKEWWWAFISAEEGQRVSFFRIFTIYLCDHLCQFSTKILPRHEQKKMSTPWNFFDEKDDVLDLKIYIFWDISSPATPSLLRNRIV